MARGEVISLTGRAFPNSFDDIAECELMKSYYEA